MSDAIAVVDPQVVKQLGDGNMLVVAEQPGQMQEAQQSVIDWFAGRVESLRRDISEAEQSLGQAQQHGWSLAPFRKIVRDLWNQLTYYTKAHTAVSNGYCIVPDFPVDIVAIRTEYEHPGGTQTTSGWKPTIAQSADKNLPAGAGEFKNNQPRVAFSHHTYKKNDRGEQVISGTVWDAAEHRDVALPVKFMKPKVLEATQRAMAMKIFDEIGVLPARKKSDPIVVGRILGPKKTLTFLIAWFIDTRDL